MQRDQLLTLIEKLPLNMQQNNNVTSFLYLGSVSKGLNYVDQYSDVDFIMVVKDNTSPQFLEDLSWLSFAGTPVFIYRNRTNTVKLLLENSIFIEFSIVEENSVTESDLLGAKLVWTKGELAFSRINTDYSLELTSDSLINEALCNLFTGVNRYKRGELLSAYRFVQVKAIENIVDLTEMSEYGADINTMVYRGERKYEERLPEYAHYFNEFIKGYSNTPASVLSILDFLSKYFHVNNEMTKIIAGKIKSSFS